MKHYAGDRTIDGLVVTVDGNPLDPRTDVHTYSEVGFEWTFVGDESRQLSLAILCDHLDDHARATALVEGFTAEIVANFTNEWEMSSDDVAAAISALE